MSAPVSAMNTCATLTPTPGMVAQHLDLMRPRRAGRLDYEIQLGQRVLDHVQAVQDRAGQPGVVGVEVAGQRLGQFGGSCRAACPSPSGPTRARRPRRRSSRASMARAETVFRLDTTADSLMKRPRASVPAGWSPGSDHPSVGPDSGSATATGGISGGGTKMAAARHSSNWPIHSAVPISVFRPETALMCARQPHLHHLLQAVERRLPVRRRGLDRRHRHPHDEQPVPMASASGSGRERPRPATAADPPSGPRVRTHTVTDALPTSSRATRSNMTPSRPSPVDHDLVGRPVGIARRGLCQDTDPRAHGSNQGAPRPRAGTPRRAQRPAPVCYDVAGQHREFSYPRAASVFKIANRHTSCITGWVYSLLRIPYRGRGGYRDRPEIGCLTRLAGRFVRR